jgi:hypothetical protein
MCVTFKLLGMNFDFKIINNFLLALLNLKFILKSKFIILAATYI